MAENEKTTKTLTTKRPSKLSLTKTVEGGKVTQNFSRGVSKSVTVEVRKTRTFSRKPNEKTNEESATDVKEKINALKAEASEQTQGVRDKGKLKSATSEVQSKTIKPQQETVVRKKKTLEAQKELPVSQDEVAKETTPKETAQNKEAYEETYNDTNGFSPRVRNKGTLRSLDTPRKTKPTNKPDVITAPKKEIEQSVAILPESVAIKKPIREKVFAPTPSAAQPVRKEEERKKKIKLKGGDNRRGSNKLTVSQALDFQEERMRSLASVKRQREKMRRLEGGSSEAKEKIIREVIVPESITVQDLANRMAERVTDVIKELMKMGTIATGAQLIDADTAELVIGEFGHTIKRVTEADVENILIEEPDNEARLKPRAPIVTVMGHVDHGKTSLLDALRKTDVVEGEAGGITQHIAAYQVKSGNQKITFLDTPGHEAFSAMRARGAKATDIIVLVVAADDGIKAQTEEAISHAKAAEVPIIVAINKMDKPAADAGRVRNELMQHELVPEEFGGDIQCIEVSAKTRQGLDELVEALALQAEILELKANPDRKASGTIVEARMDKARGTIATLLVQRGSLKVADIIVAGSTWGRVRSLINDHGREIDKATPSQPVEILGLDEAPLAGDDFSVVEDEKTARDITEFRIHREKERRNLVAAKTLDQLFASSKEGEHKKLNLIIKGDVQGSIEAIIGSLSKFNNDEISVKVVHSAVGAVNESDVSLALATESIIIGFNVRSISTARELAENEKIDVRYYAVIYDLVDDIKSALSGMLSPDMREKLLGYAEIREVFNITKVGKVAGCMVTEGMIRRGAKVRLLRDNVVIHEGVLKTLKRLKEEVKEVKSGYECGMAFENYDDIRTGDMIEAFEIEEIARTIT